METARATEVAGEGNAMTKKTIELNVSGNHNWPDYVIRVWPWNGEQDCYVAEVEAFEVCGRNGLQPDSPLLFEGKDALVLPQDLTTDIEAAETIIRGSIKWDGCSDLTMGYMHHCGPSEVIKLGKLFEAIFEQAKEVLGSHCDW